MLSHMWQKLIDDITKKITQVDLVNELKRSGVLASQPTISRLKHGVMTEPRYSLGHALIEMHRKLHTK